MSDRPDIPRPPGQVDKLDSRPPPTPRKSWIRDLPRTQENLDAFPLPSVFSMPDKEWVGPIESAYGLHIVKVDNIVSEIIPQFKDIENAVLSQWKEEERRRINKDALAKIIDKYKINIINDKTK